MDTVRFKSGGTWCSAWHLPAQTDALQSPDGRPCVVMAHGFGCTRDGGLLPFAERFAAAGLEVLLFDYRGYGTSDGSPRQDVNHRKHRQDYQAAVAYAGTLTAVDRTRIAVWGTSYSGGHVIAVAAGDPTIAAVISQGAAMDGLAALRMSARSGEGMSSAAGRTKARATAAAIARDIVRALTRHRPITVPVFGEAGSTALITSSGGVDAVQAILGPTFRNEMCARGLLRIPLNRPVTRARGVRCPTMLVIAEHDEIAPARSVREVARRVGTNAEVMSFECGHFDIYVGEVFTKSVAAQVTFLAGHLAPRKHSTRPTAVTEESLHRE
jgi:hypothetical protein